MEWVVVFRGARDAYQVPLALSEAGQLGALFTDWYSPLDRIWFRSAARLLPSSLVGQLTRRYQAGLPSSKVRLHPLHSVRARWLGADPSAGDGYLGARAGRYAESHSAGILSYSYYAHGAFSSCRDGAVPKVLLQVHPHPASLRRLFSEEMERTPEARASLSEELEIRLDEPRFTRLCREPELADLCIVASAYTMRTLVDNGVPAERIRVVPYGVDLERFSPPPVAPSGRFRVLFVGQMVQRKGLSYLLEAWRRLELDDAELVLAGRGRVDESLLKRYAGMFRLETALSHNALLELYRSTDVFCMPSLAEGFGLVYLEALACGTPVITTPSTGAADVVQDGEQGFVVPIRDVDALADRLRWCYEHRSELEKMRYGARTTAERYSWSAFRARLAAAVAYVQ